MLEVRPEEVLGQRPSVAQTLQGAVHETRVAEVVEANYTIPGIRHLLKSQILDGRIVTAVFPLAQSPVVLEVLPLAVRIAIEDLLALALLLKQNCAIAAIALAELSRILIIAENKVTAFGLDLNYYQIVVVAETIIAPVNIPVSFVEHHIELEARKLNAGVLLDVRLGVVGEHLCGRPAYLILLEELGEVCGLRVETIAPPQADLGILKTEPFVGNSLELRFELLERLALMHVDRLLALLSDLCRVEGSKRRQQKDWHLAGVSELGLHTLGNLMLYFLR